MSDDKLDINDPGFFSNENLDEIAEVHESGFGDPEPGPIADDSESEDVDDSDDSDGSDSLVEDVVDEDDPAPQLKDLATAKKSYADLRAYANLTKQELDELKAELERLQSNASVPSDDDFYDADQFRHLAENAHPAEAFRYALENNNFQDALRAIGRVQADAVDIAAQVALARQDGDDSTAANLSEAASNASALAESLRAELFYAQQEASMAPTRQREFMSDMAGASARVRSRHADASEFADDIGRIVNEFPQILGDGSPAAIEAGLERALFMARGQAAKNGNTNIDEIVAQKVAEALNQSRSSRRSSASSAMGEGAGRSVASSRKQSDQDVVREGMGLGENNGSIGFKEFWNLNK